MALKVKKKKKKKRRSFSGGGSSPGGGTRETPLRPEKIEKEPPCQVGCPNGTRIRDVLTTISQTEDRGRTYPESFEMAYNIILERNPLPATCGRVCPHPCEGECNRGDKDGPLGINNIERFLGDYAIDNDLPIKKLTDETYSEKIAIVGGGPAGLSAAYQLAIRGYENVTVYESNSKAGGMLRYGIPDYRLPEDILDKEIDRIQKLGIDLKYNVAIGKDMPIDKLREEHDAIFVGIGAHSGKKLRVEGEDAPNVWTGVSFLHKVNSGASVDVGDKVLVIGGGDTAIDAARIAKRLGADVTVVYRRTRKEMPAIEEEIVGAEEEDIKFHFLAAPVELEKDGDKVVKMKCQQMELGEPDDSGRRRPVPIEGDYFELECTTILSAISQEPDFEGFNDLREGKDWIKVDDHFQTCLENTFAGGDAVDLGLVTIAVYQGRKAAETIHAKFRGIEPDKDPEEDLEVLKKNRVVMSHYEEKARKEAMKLPPEERLKYLDKEISKTLKEEDVIEESKRCFSCGMCFDCGTCWSMCQDQAIHKPLEKFDAYTFNMDLCRGCFKCVEACPCGYLEMKDPGTGKVAPRDDEGKVVYDG